MNSPWVAWPTGSDPVRLALDVGAAHERFVTTGSTASATDPVRRVVLDSWRRSVFSGVDPEASAPPVQLLDDELRDYRDAHPLAAVMPVIRRLLVADAVDDGLIVGITDVAGRLLWVEGEDRLRSRAETMAFVEGACWREEYAGTNAPGTALAVDQPVQIYSSEHFRRNVQPWSCSAAPIHDPTSGDVLGVLDVTGGQQVASPQMLMVVRSTVAAVEAELRLQGFRADAPDGGASPRRRPPVPTVARQPPRLESLGRERASVVRQGDRIDLSLRHSELLVLLATNPAGLTAEQLAVALHSWECSPVTVRAEMTRLRRILGPGALASRPYRLTESFDHDVSRVAALLDNGAYRQVLEVYAGPVLPHSDAPAIVELREELQRQVRDAMIAHAETDLLHEFASRPDGSGDLQLWAAYRDRLPAGSRRRTRAESHLAWLESQLA